MTRICYLVSELRRGDQDYFVPLIAFRDRSLAEDYIKDDPETQYIIEEIELEGF